MGCPCNGQDRHPHSHESSLGLQPVGDLLAEGGIHSGAVRIDPAFELQGIDCCPEGFGINRAETGN